MGQINNVINIPASTEKRFFRYWLEFLKPFHKLTDKETEIMAEFLRQRHELSKVIKDQELLDRVVMSEDTKRTIRTECGISQTYFQVIMTKLKKSKMVDNGKINPKFIPRLKEDADNFQLLISFNLK